MNLGIGWKIGTFIMAGIAAFIGVVALIDNISNRATIRELRGSITSAEKARDAANTNLGTCHANVGNLGGKLDTVGAQITKLGDDTRAADARGLAAAQAAAKNAKDAKASADRVLAMPLPPPDLACMEAARLLRVGP